MESSAEVEKMLGEGQLRQRLSLVSRFPLWQTAGGVIVVLKDAIQEAKKAPGIQERPLFENRAFACEPPASSPAASLATPRRLVSKGAIARAEADPPFPVSLWEPAPRLRTLACRPLSRRPSPISNVSLLGCCVDRSVIRELGVSSLITRGSLFSWNHLFPSLASGSVSVAVAATGIIADKQLNEKRAGL